MKDFFDYAIVGTAIFLIVAAVCGWYYVARPMIVIWALNTLFPRLAIPFDSYTILAAIVPCVLYDRLAGRGRSSREEA